MATTPEELAEEAVRAATGSICRDPERLRKLTKSLGELLAGDPKTGFLTVAVVASYSCDRQGHAGEVHAVTGLMTRDAAPLEQSDVRLVARRLRELGDETERLFPAPEGEVPLEERP